jgi:hypothetical protein
MFSNITGKEGEAMAYELLNLREIVKEMREEAASARMLQS